MSNPGRKNKLDKFQDILFRNFEEAVLTEDEKRIIHRLRSAFTLSLENPTLPDVQLRDYLMNQYGISQAQAYKDIADMRLVLGSVKNAEKEWVRYMVNETLKKCIEDAKNLGAKGLKLMIMAADKLGKYNRLDRDDAVEMPWEEIIPQSIEPTNDPTVLGVKPLENKEESIRKMYEKYRDEIEDVEYEPA